MTGMDGIGMCLDGKLAVSNALDAGVTPTRNPDDFRAVA